MNWHPHPFQQALLSDAIAFFAANVAGSKRPYTAPTGTGKGFVEAALVEACPDMWLICPRVEICRELMTRLGVKSAAEAGDSELSHLMNITRVATPVRLRNALLKGEAEQPKLLCIDEGHHSTASTWRDIMALAGPVPSVMFTATFFRGTPKGTAELKAEWGEPIVGISWSEAIAEKYLSLPICETVPLVDDDVVDIVNGEFSVTQVDHVVRHSFSGVAARASREVTDGHWHRATMFTLPTRQLAHDFAHFMNELSMPVLVVTGETPSRERRRIFAMMKEGHAALAQVKVVSEGVDLPVRVQFDMSPMVSPVAWLQQFGRGTRPVKPGEDPPRYICFNRNLLRFAWLLDGVLPKSVILEASALFGGFGKRGLGIRVVGLEGVGRFKSTPVRFRDGLEGAIYCVAAAEDAKVREWAALVHPAREEPVWATREITKDSVGEKTWGRWKRVDPPTDLRGFQSISAGAITPKMEAWWKREAAFWGLDNTILPSQRAFVALPMLKDTRRRMV